MKKLPRHYTRVTERDKGILLHHGLHTRLWAKRSKFDDARTIDKINESRKKGAGVQRAIKAWAGFTLGELAEFGPYAKERDT